MTITVGSPNLSNWKHLKAGYVAAAGALAIAAGALVAVAPWHQAASPQHAAASAAPTSFYRTAETQKAVFYLVGSQPEADRLNGAIAAEGGTAGLNESMSVVVVDTPEMEASIKMTGLELTSLGTNYEIIDLRDR